MVMFQFASRSNFQGAHRKGTPQDPAAPAPDVPKKAWALVQGIPGQIHCGISWDVIDGIIYT
jgi:hypothetical protein